MPKLYKKISLREMNFECSNKTTVSTLFRAGGTGGARGAVAPPDFPRFNIVGVDQTLKPIKVFKCWPPRFLDLPPALPLMFDIQT